ncbi:FAD-dependent oxidoreductase [Albirhodobacter sp. R86504]|uniref:FAD-dependent oxidoreductase n=1 Tax=Albirhodobacter sp. R86504 TaxID=3093848 RepID=UPI003672EB7C
MSEKPEKSVVLVGGGHTHALVLQGMTSAPLEGAQVTVINPGPTAPYSGMLPGFVAGHYTRKELDIDLAALAQKANATLIDGEAKGIDLAHKLIHLENGESVSYDFASIDVGITSRMDGLQGFRQYAIPVKPLGPFSARWDAFRSTAGPKHVIIIGGGIAGAELAMAMAFALRGAREPVSVRLLDRGRILSANSVKAQKRVRKELDANGVQVLEGVEVAEVRERGVVFTDGRVFEANFVVGAAGATPHAWVPSTGLVTKDGFIDVNRSLETNEKGVFAVGDCANMTVTPRPKAGVYAVRQAPILLANLRKSLAGEALDHYNPQTDYLKLVSLGGKRAFGEKSGLGFAGNLVWRLKDRIDRSFMDQF